MGGEEFLSSSRGWTGAKAASGWSGSARDRRVRLGRVTEGIAVTASIGVTSHGGDEVERGALLALADRNLYAAKRAGRDRVVA